MRYAVDLGGTHIRIAAAESGCNWLHQHRARHEGRMTPEEFIEILAGLTRQWSGGAAEAIGVSVAAVVDENGKLSGAENLGWKDVPLRRLLEEAFSCPAVVETDVFCGAVFEAQEGAAKEAGSALYIAIGTGVGHAFILNGQAWRGSQRGANAFGHLVTDPQGSRCYCGNRGCMCTIASGLAQAGTAPSDAPLEALGLAIGNAITLIEPERIILAGGALNQPWFDLAALAELLPRFSYPAARQPQLVRSSAADPNLCGALFLSMEKS